MSPPEWPALIRAGWNPRVAARRFADEILGLPGGPVAVTGPGPGAFGPWRVDVGGRSYRMAYARSRPDYWFEPWEGGDA